MISNIENRLKASMDCEAHDGTSSDRFIFHKQVREAIAELARLRAVNADLLAALQAVLEAEEGAGETDRPHMIQARAALVKAQS